MQPDHKRKKKRGRSSKLFKSCFRSSHEQRPPLLNNKSDGHRGNKEDFATDDVTERSTNGRGVSRLLKAVLFDAAKKTRSNSKSSIASDTSDAFLSFEKTGKQSEYVNVNACVSETMDAEDTSSSNLLSSSSRATSTSYSSSSSSSKNSNSRWPSEPKTSSPIDVLDPVSSNLSSLHKSNLVNNSSCCYNKYRSEERYNVTGSQPRHLLCCTNNSRSCSEQKSLSQTDSVSLPLAKSTSLPKPSSPYTKQLSQTELQDSADSRSLISIKSASNNLNIRWCLFLLLSLIVLVIYGRIYSILCTSIWFYLVPLGRVKRVDSVTDTTELMDTESEQYKKRVIMAGLLDRTRNSIR